ncbi:unnamed protein product [Rotaria sordida]|uniref:Long-chain-fatty-acid--CoA ligase n=2 Tax=Rotaria sordida TaxID=392033 RepID=A0A814GPI5_9BILA|nr:unnamed protein product [Rotaria sordida]
MHLFVVLIAALSFAQAVDNYQNPLIWNLFKRIHKKQYANSQEEQYRQGVFENNVAKINQHNLETDLGLHTYTLKINKFADMTHEEFLRTMVGGFKRRSTTEISSTFDRHTFLPPSNVVIPPSIDWRTKGAVTTAIEDQGQCGSCWAFTATGALEGQHFLKTGKLVRLSAQNLMDCSGKYGNQGCNGGLMDASFQYIKDNKGIDTEASYPYEAVEGTCRFKRANVGATDTGFTDLPEGNETTLQIALATVGPISVAVDASHSSFQFYSSGVYDEPDCSTTNIDHSFILVGYDTYKNGTTKQEYYIAKNSWGESWENRVNEEMTQGINSQKVTIPAEAQGYSEARVATSLGSRSFSKTGKSSIDGHVYTTIYEGFKIGTDIARKHGDNRCLGFRVNRNSEYLWLTYKEIERAATDIGSALIRLGENHGQNTFIGIYAVNSVEWLITALACHFHSMIYVPLYDTLGQSAIIHIINQTGLRTIFIDKAENVLALLKLTRRVPTLERIILTKRLSEDQKYKVMKKASRKGIQIFTYKQLLELGRLRPVAHHPPKPNYLFQICYTSGTTGLPKGAMFTHKNIVSVVQTATELLAPVFNELETLISYLPMAHAYEQAAELYCLCNGFKIGYYLGDIKLLSDDMAHLKPTFMPSVPRVLNRMYDTIQATIRQLQSSQQQLSTTGLSAKENGANEDPVARQKVLNDLVIQQVQKSLGGHVKLILCGAAPLSPTVLQFLRRVSGVHIIEGYGQTECCGLSTTHLLGDPSTGHVGVPAHCNMIKLVDVPDMEYFAKDNVGEICIKGPNVFKGYYRDKEKTREAIDRSGWLHTGDIGKWTETGHLQIIDRKKHMFKLSQGEYIAPERIENIYIQSKYIAQAFVYGNSYKSSTVAIIVPDHDVFLKYASEHHISGNMEELCKKQEIKDLIFNDIKELEKLNQLKGFELVKDIYLYPDQFSVENNLLTPTMKSKRPELAKYFEKQIDEMYKYIE